MTEQLSTKSGSVSLLPAASYDKVSTDFFQMTNTILGGQVWVDDGVQSIEFKIKPDLH
jgi:hypothetical protein